MGEIAQIYGWNSQLRATPAARNGRVQAATASGRPGESTIASAGMKLPPEQALREVARGVTDYIVTNRLTDDEGYQAFKAEFVYDTPAGMLSQDEMKLVEKLSQDLLDQMFVDPLKNTMSSLIDDQVKNLFDNPSAIAANQLEQGPSGPVNVFDAVAPDGNEKPGLWTEIGIPTIAETAAEGLIASKLTLSGEEQTLDGLTLEAAFVSKEGIAGASTTANAASTTGSTGTHDSEGLLLRQILTRGLPEGTFDSGDPLIIVHGATQRTTATPIMNPFGEGESSAATTSDLPGVTPAFVEAPQPPEASGVSAALLQGHPSALLRVDLKEILSGKMAELHIGYDEALIISRVAVLIEQVNGLARLCDEQAQVLANSQKSLSTINPALRQFIAITLGIVIDGNKVFTGPLTIGLSRGDGGLLVLDPALLRTALESNREEAVTVLKSIANSLYDNISLYVDPRLLSRFSDLPGAAAADQADRSRNEAERRFRKEKDSLEKRFQEITLILEDSAKLRDWFMGTVESLTAGATSEEARDEVIKRPLPAVDLVWDEDEIGAQSEVGQLSQEIMSLFAACTARALEEDIDASIKLLLKRKSLSDKILADKPAVESRMAMICLANEELVIEKIEAERRKVFASLDELARSSVAARTYRPRFPWPPPTAAFITSEG